MRLFIIFKIVLLCNYVNENESYDEFDVDFNGEIADYFQ
jgi:hypothetical protein